MKDNWNILKEKIQEQIKDCKRYGSRFSVPYYEVLKMMDSIENGTENELVPYNCLWKKKSELNNIEEDES